MSLGAGNLLLASAGDSGYNLTRSLRFRASATAYLSRTPASTTNQQVWTWSSWVKRGSLAAYGTLLNGYSSGANQTGILFWIDDTLVFSYTVASIEYRLTTTQVFRDPSASYHIIYAVDTTQATAANRIKLYVNGTQVTAFSGSYPPQNSNLFVNSTNVQNIGRNAGGGNNFDGYFAEVNLIDGQQLTPSSFGSTNALTGVWQPARYTGTYGTNGFYLPFTDNSALTTASNVGLGKDFSGNANYWVTNNISITAGVTYDSMTDVPTLTSATAANFAVLNPLDKGAATPSNGNLTLNNPASSHSGVRGTIALPTSGKWYFEMYIGTASGLMACTLGVVTASSPLTLSSGTGSYMHLTNDSIWQIYANGSNPTISGASTPAVGQYLQVAYDATNGKLWFGKNDTWADASFGVTGNPSAGTNATILNPLTPLFPFVTQYASFGVINFGQRPFAYTPPTGFVSLNTFNLPTSTILKGNTVMDATLYTGNGSTQNIINAAGFKPDFVWLKSRNDTYWHFLLDSVRGATKTLESNLTSAEATYANNLTSFNSNGFSLGNQNDININGGSFVGWQWQAGQGSSSSNTNGTITSTVSVNASAGFSVATYTGNGSAGATIGHGLGVAPSLIIVKNRSTGSTDWPVYHKSIGATNWLALDTTQASAANTVLWNDTSPTSSVFSTGISLYVNGSGSTYVAYCWTPIAGFSAFGSVSTNGAADNAFVYTGFLPRFVLLKRTDSTSNWFIWDTARNTFNVFGNELYPNLSNAEASAVDLDILSNGFKLRSASFSGTWIYAAFATNPFKQSLAF